MSDIDERKLLRRLNDIAGIAPSDEAAQIALDKTRQAIIDNATGGKANELEKATRPFLLSKAFIAAAMILLALIITATVILKSPSGPTTPTAKNATENQPLVDPSEQYAADQNFVGSDLNIELAAFLDQIEEYFESGQIDQAVNLLSKADPKQKAAAMNLIAKLIKQKADILAQDHTAPEVDATSLKDKHEETATDFASEDKQPATPDEYVEFSGIVIDQNGKPVKNAKVNIYVNPRSWFTDERIIISAMTEKDGFYSIKSPLPPNEDGIIMPIAIWAYVEKKIEALAWTVLLSGHDKRYGGYHQWAAKIPDSMADIEISGYRIGIARCAGASGILLQMERAGHIYGKVTNSLGQPVADAKVKAVFDFIDEEGYVRGAGFYLWPTIAYTNAEGDYFIGNLPQLLDKTHRSVRAEAEGYNSKTVGFTSEGPLEEMQVDFELLLTGITVRGTLIDNYGTMLANRRIIIEAGQGTDSIVANTDEEGRFEIADCPIAEKLVVEARLSQNNYSRDVEEYENFIYYPDVITEIEIEADKLEYEVELVAVIPDMIIDVEVVDANSNPVPYFPVAVEGVGISTEWSQARALIQRTDFEGHCTFTEVPDSEQLKLLLHYSFKVPTDPDLDPKEKKLIEELNAHYEESGKFNKWIEVPIIIVPSQMEYKVQARIPIRLNQDSPLGTKESP
jgi:hypothetical protein